jgi:hypothetical protein
MKMRLLIAFLIILLTMLDAPERGFGFRGRIKTAGKNPAR